MAVNQRTRAIIAVCFCVLVAIVTLAMMLKPGPSVDDDLPTQDGLPESAVGYGVLVQLLKAQGIQVTYAPIDSHTLHSVPGLVIFAPASPKQEFPEFKPPMRAHLLYVPAKWRLQHDLTHPKWVGIPSTLEEWDAAKYIHLPVDVWFNYARGPQQIQWRINGGDTKATFPVPGPIYDLRTFQSRAWNEILGVDGGASVLSWGSSLYLLSDPDFLNNMGMADRQTAAMAVEMLDEMRHGGPIWIAPSFIITLDSAGQSNPLPLMFQPPLLAATICIFAAAALMGWQGLVRFGPVKPPRPAFKPGKANLIESAAGLIEGAKRTPRFAPAYARLMRDLAIGPQRTPDVPEDLLRQMQERHGATQDFIDLERQAQAVGTPDELMIVARALRQWKQEITDGRT